MPVAWHPVAEDPFYTAAAQTRATFYNVGVFPTAIFDGTVRVLGGGPYTYDDYMAAYNQRRAVPSPLTITFLARSYAANHASVKVKVKLEQNISSGAVVQIILWEDKCYSGGKEFRFVQRLQASPATLTITQAGKEQTIKRTFTLNAGWDRNHLGVSAFVQRNADKEVLNGRAAKLVAGVGVAPTSLGRLRALYY